MSPKRMPGPGLFETLGLVAKFRKSYLAPMDQLFAKYGDYVMFTGGRPVVMVSHPDGVEHVLKTNGKNYEKADDMKHLRPFLGNGLLTSNGEEWKEHRKIIAPEFQHKKIDTFFPIMVRHLKDMLTEWRTKSEFFDIAPSISRTTYGIAGECFFGAHVEDTANIVYNSIEIASMVAVKRMASPINWPSWMPFPSYLKSRRAVAEMNEIVFRIIDDRLAMPSDAHDVLSRLTRTQMSREQIRDEVMTLLLAGHETTANALAWTLMLLGLHKKVQDNLRDEVLSVVSSEIPSLEELRTLRYTKMVLEESMRLFPPAATIGRKALAADEICGYAVPAGTNVNLSQWVTHRHPDFWEKPNDFHPERFANPNAHHPFAYFPFAAGPRECVGRNMAMVESIAMLAGMVRNFRFQLAESNISIKALITLRPHPGVFIKLTPVEKRRAGFAEVN